MKKRFCNHPEKGCATCAYYRQVEKRDWWGCFSDGDGSYYMFGQPVKRPCPDHDLPSSQDIDMEDVIGSIFDL